MAFAEVDSQATASYEKSWFFEGQSVVRLRTGTAGVPPAPSAKRSVAECSARSLTLPLTLKRPWCLQKSILKQQRATRNLGFFEGQSVVKLRALHSASLRFALAAGGTPTVPVCDAHGPITISSAGRLQVSSWFAAHSRFWRRVYSLADTEHTLQLCAASAGSLRTYAWQPWHPGWLPARRKRIR